MEESTILELTNIKKYFGGIKALDDINITLKHNQILGLIGPNGAGKTTIFNLITGLYIPTSGDIKYEGENIAGKMPYMIANLGVSRTFQNIRLFGQQTVLNNVLIACQNQAQYSVMDSVFRIRAFRKQESELYAKSKELIQLVGLGDREDILAKNLPYGLQRRLEIARAMALNPKILLLDEPTAGMNEDESSQLVSLIREMQERFGLSIIMIDHHMDVIMDICADIYVLNFGRMIAHGTPKEIQKDSVVVDAYLGVDE
jgi:branched-chain amino acid transport system ATP-binding protein